MAPNKLRLILFTSLTLNLLAVGTAGYELHHRHGALASLKDHLAHLGPSKTPMNPDEVTYLTRETLFEKLPAREHSIVFLGDSQTANGEWGEFFPGAINRGIGGDTSAGLLKRVPVVAALRPEAVFLMIGANDYALKIQPSETVANIKNAVSLIRKSSPDTLVYIQGLTPTWWHRRNLFVSEVNALLKPMADNKKTFYIDTFTPFLKGDLLSSDYSFDGLHLNGPGFIEWKQLLVPYLSRLSAANSRKSLAHASGIRIRASVHESVGTP
ncbi:MAG: GDSL-type esterase/lipase family protein [Candidatus Acidiferrum sp.]